MLLAGLRTFILNCQMSAVWFESTGTGFPGFRILFVRYISSLFIARINCAPPHPRHVGWGGYVMDIGTLWLVGNYLCYVLAYMSRI
jgi:hypothetical protein